MDDIQLKKLLEQLEDHDKRIRVLEGSKVAELVKGIVGSDRKIPRERTAAEDLFVPVNKLSQDGFFKAAKIDLDVVAELQRKLLTRKKPLRASVVNVLRKMVRRGILERVEFIKDKKTLIAYKNL
ncbi:MAG TPA: hypothetical protein VJH71_02090 [Candidatus Paceibacterota bacterium]